jgi:hypothetical protein
LIIANPPKNELKLEISVGIQAQIVTNN